MAEILAAKAWTSNAELIVDVAALGYIHGKVIDLTYGRGTWWKLFTPADFITNDLKKTALTDFHEDFTDTYWPDGTFDTVADDPPYKLNGTPDPLVDERYGVEEAKKWQTRMQLIFESVDEGARILAPRGHLLVKCQDQVVCGHVVWQTVEIKERAEKHGLVLVDRFDLLGKHRVQPERTRKHRACKGTGCTACTDGRVASKQQHAHGRPSTLLVFERPKPKRVKKSQVPVDSPPTV